jgi:glycosyltransferase involved in cell wall biosynthesis
VSIQLETCVDHRCPILIPAYRPGEALVLVVAKLREQYSGPIVIVDDGSGPDYQERFYGLQRALGVALLSHARNLGKGAALKTGIRYIGMTWPEAQGVVTADADGQHHPDDILRIRQTFLETGNALVLGARAFEGAIPARSRVGNSVTRIALRLLLGRNLRDTQTGLRAIPAPLWETLRGIRSPRYEFELEMLIAAKHRNTPILESGIRTIYEAGNKSSHFNPLLDSMRIWFVLLRFSMISLLTAAIDNAMFGLMFWLSSRLLMAQICGRALAVAFNYGNVRRAVFHSDQRHSIVLPRYLMLVLASGSLSYGGIILLASRFHMPTIGAKIVAETILFFVNFTVQRDYVFSHQRARGESTPLKSLGDAAHVR